MTPGSHFAKSEEAVGRWSPISCPLKKLSSTRADVGNKEHQSMGPDGTWANGPAPEAGQEIKHEVLASCLGEVLASP